MWPNWRGRAATSPPPLLLCPVVGCVAAAPLRGKGRFGRKTGKAAAAETVKPAPKPRATRAAAQAAGPVAAADAPRAKAKKTAAKKKAPPVRKTAAKTKTTAKRKATTG